MMRWTNDRWVVDAASRGHTAERRDWRSRRLSIGMFVIPNYDARSPASRAAAAMPARIRRGDRRRVSHAALRRTAGAPAY